MFLKYKELKKVVLFHIVINILFALFITLSSYYNTPLNSLSGRLVYLLHLCIVQSTFAAFIYILSLNSLVFKLFFPLLFVGLGLVAYWIFTVGISVSSTLMEVSLNSSFYIVKDLITIQLILYTLLLITIVIGILQWYKNINKSKCFVLFFPISILLLVAFLYINKKKDRTLSSKMPYNFFYALNEYFSSEHVFLKEPKNITYTEDKDIKVVLVVGESVRGDHLGINGYKRNTTPLLTVRDNLVSFKNTYTNKPLTLVSVPQLLSNQGIHDVKTDSIMPVFSVVNTINIPTVWIGNQLLEATYKPIVEKNNKVFIIDEFKSFYSFDKKKDTNLITYLKEELKANNKGLFSLHMIGSHWWYEDKYTDEFRVYKPVNNSKFIPSQSKEQMINSYDNTILYLDYFLDTIIYELEKEDVPTILIYISDHGETLGENGKWLHNDFKSLTNPAMLVWYSDSYGNMYPNKTKALKGMKDQSFTTDVIYHSILDLFKIDQFNSKQSIFYCED